MLNREHLATVPLHEGLRESPAEAPRPCQGFVFRFLELIPDASRKGRPPISEVPTPPSCDKTEKEEPQVSVSPGRTRLLIPQSKGKTFVLREEPLSWRGFLTTWLSQHPSYTWTQRQGREQSLKCSEAFISCALLLLRVHV